MVIFPSCRYWISDHLVRYPRKAVRFFTYRNQLGGTYWSIRIGKFERLLFARLTWQIQMGDFNCIKLSVRCEIFHVGPGWSCRSTTETSTNQDQLHHHHCFLSNYTKRHMTIWVFNSIQTQRYQYPRLQLSVVPRTWPRTVGWRS
jgi:hypothetical protein